MKLPTHLALVLKEFALRIETYLTGDFSAATLEEKQKHCADVRQLAAIAGASLAPIPIPFADIWTITPVQIAMVQAIGNIYGYNLEGKNLKAAFATVAGGWLGQQACLALFKIGMPGAGGFGGAAFVWVWTHAMGRVAEKYFSSGMKLSKEELRKIREEELKNAKPSENESLVERQRKEIQGLSANANLRDEVSKVPPPKMEPMGPEKSRFNTCPVCGGDGGAAGHCYKCDGTGWVSA